MDGKGAGSEPPFIIQLLSQKKRCKQKPPGRPPGIQVWVTTVKSIVFPLDLNCCSGIVDCYPLISCFLQRLAMKLTIWRGAKWSVHSMSHVSRKTREGERERERERQKQIQGEKPHPWGKGWKHNYEPGCTDLGAVHNYPHGGDLVYAVSPVRCCCAVTATGVTASWNNHWKPAVR